LKEATYQAKIPSIKLIQGSAKLPNQTGKRYICSQCNAEFIVTKGGNGNLVCCGQPMQLK